MLTIGTFGKKDLPDNRERQGLEDESQSLSQELAAEFTPEEVEKLQAELANLLTRKPASKVDGEIANLPLDRFLNCPSSLEVDRRLSSTLCSDLINKEEEDEEDIDRTIQVILGRCRDACMESNKKSIGKKSVSFLLKKMFVCRSGFAPTPGLRDTLPESRMEKVIFVNLVAFNFLPSIYLIIKFIFCDHIIKRKLNFGVSYSINQIPLYIICFLMVIYGKVQLLRTMLSKKVYAQNSSRASSMKKYIEDTQMPSMRKQDEIEDKSNDQKSKWVKTDSECKLYLSSVQSQ